MRPGSPAIGGQPPGPGGGQVDGVEGGELPAQARAGPGSGPGPAGTSPGRAPLREERRCVMAVPAAIAGWLTGRGGDGPAGRPAGRRWRAAAAGPRTGEPAQPEDAQRRRCRPPPRARPGRTPVVGRRKAWSKQGQAPAPCRPTRPPRSGRCAGWTCARRSTFRRMSSSSRTEADSEPSRSRRPGPRSRALMTSAATIRSARGVVQVVGERSSASGIGTGCAAGSTSRASGSIRRGPRPAAKPGWPVPGPTAPGDRVAQRLGPGRQGLQPGQWPALDWRHRDSPRQANDQQRHRCRRRQPAGHHEHDGTRREGRRAARQAGPVRAAAARPPSLRGGPDGACRMATGSSIRRRSRTGRARRAGLTETGRRPGTLVSRMPPLPVVAVLGQQRGAGDRRVRHRRAVRPRGEHLAGQHPPVDPGDLPDAAHVPAQAAAAW